MAASSNRTTVAIRRSAPAPMNAADNAVNVSFSEISARRSCSSVCSNVAISFKASPARSTTSLSLARVGRRRLSVSSDAELAAIVPSHEAARHRRGDNGSSEFWFRAQSKSPKRAPGARVRLFLFPEFAVIGEIRQDWIGTRRLHQGEQSTEHSVDRSGCMPHVEIYGVKRVAQVPLWIIVETAAVKSSVAVG